MWYCIILQEKDEGGRGRFKSHSNAPARISDREKKAPLKQWVHDTVNDFIDLAGGWEKGLEADDISIDQKQKLPFLDSSSIIGLNVPPWRLQSGGTYVFITHVL